MANTRQAAKRARQAEKRRLRNMHYKSTMRTHVKNVRYALQSFETLRGGKSLHQQEVEKYLRFLSEAKAADYVRAGHPNIVEGARALLGRYSPDAHKEFLVQLAGAELHLAEKAIRHAASKGVIHPRTADRKVSRLATAVAAMARAHREGAAAA